MHSCLVVVLCWEEGKGKEINGIGDRGRKGECAFIGEEVKGRGRRGIKKGMESAVCFLSGRTRKEGEGKEWERR